MEKFVQALPDGERPTDWVLSPNAVAAGGQDAARAMAHGAFDDDPATLQATLARILNKSSSAATFVRHRSGSSNRAQRAVLAQ